LTNAPNIFFLYNISDFISVGKYRGAQVHPFQIQAAELYFDIMAF